MALPRTLFLASRRRSRRWLWVGTLAVAMAVAGCRAESRPPAQSANDSAAEHSTSQSTLGAAAAPQPSRTGRETWHVHFLGDAKVGHGRTRIVPQDDGRLRYESDEEITIDRGGSSVTQQIRAISLEEPTGELVRCQSRMNLGPATTETRCEVLGGDRLRIETVVQGKSTVEEIPWRREWGGFFAVDQALERAPMQPGETRSLRALQPLVNQIGETQLTARELEDTPLLLGSQRLLRIDERTTIAGVTLDITRWTDERGETWKTYLPNLRQTTYRATQETALGDHPLGKYDLFDNITIRLAAPLQKGHDAQRVVYRARLASGDPAAAFVADASQSVRRLDEHTAEITVRAIRPGQPPTLPRPAEPPTGDDLAPNSLIQSDDPRIVELASRVAPEESDPWTVAVALEQFVRGAITAKNFSQAFATAAEVAQTREGDCTEHAVFLAALCRARKIPARCAMGLVCLPPQQGAALAYHMWTEVWIKDRWVPLDGTLGRGGTGGAHLKLAHSNLKGAGSYAAFLPLFRVLGQLELEVIEEE